jgi:uncharacterized membrane protein YkvA (DUF1232 family)
MNERQWDFYQRLRSRMREWLRSQEGSSHQWVEYLIWAPDLFHLLCRLSLDKRVPAGEKVKLAGAIAYFVSPLDLVPEVILGPVGFVDDIAVAAYVLHSVVNSTDAEVLREHWAGDEDVLQVIRSVLAVADRMIGSGLWDKLRRRF